MNSIILSNIVLIVIKGKISPGLKNCTLMVAPPSTIKASTSPVRLSQPKAGRAVYRFAFLCGVYDPVSRSDREAVG
jgi:hypothetical protein